MNKYIPSIIGILIFCAFVVGCSKRSSFYEINGVAFNLARVSSVSSSARITVTSVPRRASGADGSLEQALYNAHSQFCRERAPVAEKVGTIMDIANGFNTLRDAIAGSLTPEVVKTCRIIIRSEAIIRLDDSPIELQRGEFSLPPLDSSMAPTMIQSAVKAEIDKHVLEPMLWKREWENLQSNM